MDDLVKKYLQEKYGENYDQKAQGDYDSARDTNRWANLGSNIGDAIAGNKVGSANSYFQDLNKQAKENTIGKIENDRNSYIDNQIKSGQLADVENRAQVRDPNSDRNKRFRASLMATAPKIANAMGDRFNDLTEDNQDTLFKFHQLNEQTESRKNQDKARLDERQDRREQIQLNKDAVKEEKMQGLKTPFGLANTIDDAKIIKQGFESKQNFDRQLDELIQLRKDYGGEVMNREAVARASQLSKNLLLEYKNMAKLGVLSQSDENIINAILPPDPLKFRDPISAMSGQDPILSNLKKFKTTSDSDFATKIATRTRAGVENAAAPPEKTVVKTQTNKKTGEKRIVYSDGSTELISNTAGR